MPSEWLGVHGGRSYGPSPRGKSLPGPAVRVPGGGQFYDENCFTFTAGPGSLFPELTESRAA